MELEFLNTEPDGIGSQDMQIALDSFCEEIRDFLLPFAHGYMLQIRAALREGQTLRGMITGIYFTEDWHLEKYCEAISNWVNVVFKYPIYEEAFEGLEPDAEIKAFLSNRDNDIPRRLTAMNRLRKALHNLANPEQEACRVRIDMSDWDMQQRRLLA